MAHSVLTCPLRNLKIQLLKTHENMIIETVIYSENITVNSVKLNIRDKYNCTLFFLDS